MSNLPTTSLIIFVSVIVCIGVVSFMLKRKFLVTHPQMNSDEKFFYCFKLTAIDYAEYSAVYLWGAALLSYVFLLKTQTTGYILFFISFIIAVLAAFGTYLLKALDFAKTKNSNTWNLLYRNSQNIAWIHIFHKKKGNLIGGAYLKFYTVTGDRYTLKVPVGWENELLNAAFLLAPKTIIGYSLEREHLYKKDPLLFKDLAPGVKFQ